MTVVSFAQLCLATMLFGLYIFDYQDRQQSIFINAPGIS